MVEILIKIAAAKEEDDSVRDVALRRLGDLPRKPWSTKLYSLFTNDMWQVRWIAAELVLKMSDTSHVDEFMRNSSRAEGMSISEPLIYGARIAEMKGPVKPADLADQIRGPGQLGAGSFDRARLLLPRRRTRISSPRSSRTQTIATKVPECKEEREGMRMEVRLSRAETKDITTVGEFVEYCVKPAMEKRSGEGKKEGEKKEEKK